MIQKSNKGVTLIELMIVLVIAAILVGGIYTLFTAQQRSYFVQDRVAGIQQDARAALDFMARDIRIAAFQTGPGSSTGFNDISINGTINFGVVPGNGTGADGSDQITLVTARDTGAWVLDINTEDTDDNYIYLDDNSPGLGGLGTINVGDAVDDYVAFEGLNRVYIIKTEEVDMARSYPLPPATPTDTVPAITLTNSTEASRPTLPPPDHLSQETFGGGVSGAGARVYLVDTITYNINNNTLQRSGNPLAGDGITTIVEDLQFAYQIAGDATWYNGSFPTGKSAADIRMVRITIIVRTAVPDPEETGFFKPACEDRGQENTFTGCRRRVYSTIVKVRNL